MSAEPHARGEPVSRVWIVVLAAAIAPVIWCWWLFGTELIALMVFAMLASAAVWLSFARWLEDTRDVGKRLLLAMAMGLLSPVLGMGIVTLATACSPCCLLTLAAPGGFAMLFEQPQLFFPFGFAMGLFAFAMVSLPGGGPRR